MSDLRTVLVRLSISLFLLVDRIQSMCDVLELSAAYNRDLHGLYYAAHDMSCTGRHVYRQDNQHHYLYHEKGQWILAADQICKGRGSVTAYAKTSSDGALPEHVYSQWQEKGPGAGWINTDLEIECYVNGLSSDDVNSRVGFSAGAAVGIILLISFVVGCIKRRLRAAQNRARFEELESLSSPNFTVTEPRRVRGHMASSYIMTIADLPAPPRTLENMNLPRDTPSYSVATQNTRYQQVFTAPPGYAERVLTDSEPTEGAPPPSYEEAVYKTSSSSPGNSTVTEPPPYAGAPPEYTADSPEAAAVHVTSQLPADEDKSVKREDNLPGEL